MLPKVSSALKEFQKYFITLSNNLKKEMKYESTVSKLSFLVLCSYFLEREGYYRTKYSKRSFEFSGNTWKRLDHAKENCILQTRSTIKFKVGIQWTLWNITRLQNWQSHEGPSYRLKRPWLYLVVTFWVQILQYDTLIIFASYEGSSDMRDVDGKPFEFLHHKTLQPKFEAI